MPPQVTQHRTTYHGWLLPSTFVDRAPSFYGCALISLFPRHQHQAVVFGLCVKFEVTLVSGVSDFPNLKGTLKKMWKSVSFYSLVLDAWIHAYLYDSA